MRMQDNYRGGGYKYKKKTGVQHPVLLGTIAVLLVTVLVLVGLMVTKGNKGPQPSHILNATPTLPGTTGLPSADNPATPGASTEKPYEPENNKARIVMVGDFLLHETTTLRSALQQDGSYNYKPYFEQIKSYLQGDLVIGLMETPVNAYGDRTGYAGYPRFNAPPEIAEAAKSIGINTFITSNNHALDCGFDGLVNTIDSIKGAGIDPIGTYKNSEDSKKYYIKEYNNIKIGILAYTDSGITDLESKIGANTFCMNIFDRAGNDTPEILNDIEAIKAQGAEFVVVSLHWGMEYRQTTESYMKNMAQELIEGGADIIMGTHPHCVQEVKKKTVTVDGIEKEVVIAYSLGNFFADQRARLQPEVEKAPPMTEEGAILTVDIERDSNGKIVIKDSYYTPTYAFRRESQSSGTTTLYDYMVLPAGKYALAAARPEYFETDEEWQEVKDAWTHTTQIMGNSIRANSN